MPITSRRNPLLLTDSYKFSHWKQLPDKVTDLYAYFEARAGGRYKEVTFNGLQPMLDLISGPVVDYEDVVEAADIAAEHMGSPDVFNVEGFTRMVKKYGGVLPLEVAALPEGIVVPEGTPLFAVYPTDPEFAWLPGYYETYFVQNWYPTTVATNSREAKKIILKYLEETGDPAGIDFKLHDFGCRGVSSMESAAIGGAAHLLNFMGTDTVPALKFVRDHYDTKVMPAFSIPAMEHSTVTSWKKSGEGRAFKNMLDKFPNSPLVAMVIDSYDPYNAAMNILGRDLRDQVISRNGTVVVRPDSGDPTMIVGEIVSLLFNSFGGTLNNKGYKVLDPHVRVIQGDGITNESIPKILEHLKFLGFSADNVAFGMGGGLLQQVNRDNQRCAYKCSEIVADGEVIAVFKEPKTDPSKRSKSGRFGVLETLDGGVRTVPAAEAAGGINLFQPIWRNGKFLQRSTWEQARTRANKWMQPKSTGGHYFTR